MCGHDNRGRYTVALGGNWRLYTNSAPAGCTMLGTITRGGIETGALALTEAGIYSMINARVFCSLDQRKVAAAIITANLGVRQSGCQRCGHLAGNDWLDGGETCPNCKLVQ